MKSTDIKAGQVFEIQYPFIRVTFNALDDDGCGSVPMQSWRPGHEYRWPGPEDLGDAECDAFGLARFTVIGTFRPSPYPERVFYRRAFCSPDGAWFGKPKLHIAVTSKFRRLVAGYQIRCRAASAQVAA